MNISRPLRLVMAPLVCSLTLAALDSAPAAPVKKAPPAAVVEAPAPPPAKRPFLQKLNPFRKKDPPPAPAPPPVPAKNSKKSAKPAAPAPAVVPPPPVKPVVPPVAAAPSRPVTPATNATPPEDTKKAGFFSRLKARLDRDPDAVNQGEKPERPVDWQEHWVVTEDSTGFYEFGPSQASGPDRRLARGQVVKLAQPGKGWARVELEGGKQGYIGTDQMRQATESDFAEPLLRPSSQLAATGASPMQGWSPAAPLPDLPDLPMPSGSENSLLLLPPLEYEGAELKRSSLRIPLSEPPTLKPGDALPPLAPAPALDPTPPAPVPDVAPVPVQAPEKEKAPETPAPVEPAPADPAPVEPDARVKP